MKIKNIRKVIQREIAAVLSEQEIMVADVAGTENSQVGASSPEETQQAEKLPETADGFQFKIHKDLNATKKGLKPKTKKRFQRIAKRGPVIKVTNYMWGKDSKWDLAGKRSYDILLKRIKDAGMEIADVVKKLQAGDKLIMSGDSNVDKLFSEKMKGDPFQYEIQLVKDVKVDTTGAPKPKASVGQQDRPESTATPLPKTPAKKPEPKKCPPPTEILKRLDDISDKKLDRAKSVGNNISEDELTKLVNDMHAFLKSCPDPKQRSEYANQFFDYMDEANHRKHAFTALEQHFIYRAYMKIINKLGLKESFGRQIKITASQLRQIIKEEMSRMDNDPDVNNDGVLDTGEITDMVGKIEDDLEIESFEVLLFSDPLGKRGESRRVHVNVNIAGHKDSRESKEAAKKVAEEKYPGWKAQFAEFDDIGGLEANL